jgi:diketogulonate reductase-like aldo/keto reductase
MVNQIEASVTLQYPDIVQYCRDHSIVPQAYSPFGRGRTDIPTAVNAMAEKYDKDAGQIAIKYLLQLGYAVVYLSNSADRMVSNTNVFDFELSQADMELLNSLHRPDGGWGLPSPHELD